MNLSNFSDICDSAGVFVSRKILSDDYMERGTLQEECRYHFCFLTPKDYDIFFDHLRQGNIMSFQSSLDVALLGQGT